MVRSVTVAVSCMCVWRAAQRAGTVYRILYRSGRYVHSPAEGVCIGLARVQVGDRTSSEPRNKKAYPTNLNY